MTELERLELIARELNEVYEFSLHLKENVCILDVLCDSKVKEFAFNAWIEYYEEDIKPDMRPEAYVVEAINCNDTIFNYIGKKYGDDTWDKEFN